MTSTIEGPTGFGRVLRTGLLGKARAMFHGLGPKGEHPSRKYVTLPAKECGNCRFGTPGAYPMTYCRRYAPREHRTHGQNTFPQVSIHDWCGEFEPR